MPKILLVDDEDQFRESLAHRLNLRGYETASVNNGIEAIKAVRSMPEIDVVVLDRKIPDMSGEETLREIKLFRPEMQVILLTAHGTLESAVEVGRDDAFTYLEKPCDTEELIHLIGAAREEKLRAMERYEIPPREIGSILEWLKGSHNSRPGLILVGGVLFVGILFFPMPDRLLEVVSSPKTKKITDLNVGYANYGKMNMDENISDFYSRAYNRKKTEIGQQGERTTRPLTPAETAFRAKVMLAVLVVAIVFWSTAAIPIGITALFVGVCMYFFDIMEPDGIAEAYARDAVLFIFGVLAMTMAITKTGLDRRIGLLLLFTTKSVPQVLFIFLPLLAISCSFVSEHALVAFLMPLFMMIYSSAIREAKIRRDPKLAVVFVLSLCFAANSGGPGSPAAGGRNAVMLGILSDYGAAPTFGQWLKYGLPFVPVMALVVAVYFYLFYRLRVEVRHANVSHLVRKAAMRIGPMNYAEYVTAAALVTLIVLWTTCSDRYGMGGPVILTIVILNLLRVLRWRDITQIHWEVVALYASACALGKGLAVTGAALYMADMFISVLPDFMRSGEGLAVAASIMSGVITNFMSDGATVSAIGPITVPMAVVSGTSPWMVGLATSFASSFAHMFIVGTPNNAIAYALAKDPVTGEQIVTLGDFVKHGFIVLILSFLVLWLWVIFGYWRWVSF